ncbi:MULTISPECIES: DsbA family protein [Morganellaceae]
MNKLSTYQKSVIALLTTMVGVGITSTYLTTSELKQTNVLLASSITIQNATKTESAGVNQSLSKILSLSENTEPVQQPEAQPEEPDLNLSQVQLDSNTLTYGNENARFSLVTYMDFQCPYCQRFASTPKTLVDKANGGLVNWKWKNSPLPFHEPNATDYAVKMLCAGAQNTDNHWKIISMWGNHEFDFATADMIGMFGLDPVAYNTCLKTDSVKLTLDKDKAESRSLGVSGTPTTVIVDNKTGEKRVIEGAVPMDMFVNTIEAMMKKSQ